MIFVDSLSASDLKWMPGMWPVVFVKGTQTWHRSEHVFDPEGDVISTIYLTRDRVYRLEVFND